MKKTLSVAVLCLALVFQGAVHTPVAHAAACSKVGGQSGRLKHSGVVSGDSAKICGRELWRLLPKPTKPSKPKIQNPAAKKVNWKNQFSVTPDRPRISHLGSLSIQVGEALTLTSLALKHTRNRMLLWYPTQVRFKPIGASWKFGDGAEATGSIVEHRWEAEGSYVVRLLVSYSVKYRILGRSEWVRLPGEVSALSSPLTITVGAKPAVSSGEVRLVHWNCVQKPNALGC